MSYYINSSSFQKDKMALLPEDDRLRVEIEIEDKQFEDELRSYLGLSQIGKKCARELWYLFRWCSKNSNTARSNRLLQRGHREEQIIVEDLKSIGIKTYNTGDDQIELTTGHGHIKGHCDGIGENIPDAPKTPHLLEFKTANHKNFTKLKKDGVKSFSKVYYAQCLTYMYLAKLKRTLFVAVNKNDDERYYERLRANSTEAKEIIKRGVDIISTEHPPEKIGNATWFECKWCNYSNICHYGEAVLKTCRSCDMCDIHDDGVWKCSRYGGLQLSTSQQKIACDKYEILKTLR